MKASAPTQVFTLATKLRNALLFREALIWVVGNYEEPAFRKLKDPKLSMLAEYVYGRIAIDVALVTSKLLIINSQKDQNGYSLKPIRRLVFADGGAYHCDDDIDEYFPICFPQYFRKLLDDPDMMYLNELSNGILENRLRLSGTGLRTGESVKDVVAAEEYFLCATIPDELLPWDPNEVDW